MARFAPVKTVVSPEKMIQTMALTWDRVSGSDPYTPSPRTLCLLAAQWALETASGQSMMNNNPAGIKANTNEDHTYYWTFEDLPPTQAQAIVDRSTTDQPAEFHDGTTEGQENDKVRKNGNWRVHIGPDHPASRFRSYDTLTAGVEDYLRRLKSGKFAPAWQEVVKGDPSEFAQKLKDLKYYTADAWDYAHALAIHFNNFMTTYGKSGKDIMKGLNGTWDVTIGRNAWSGIFVFSGTAEVYWEDPVIAKGKKHKGFWWSDDEAIRWQFDDDPAGWRRTFVITLPFKTPMTGNVLPQGRGFFEMTKRG